MERKKILLIFGASGALGKGASEALAKYDYYRIYFFGSSADGLPDNDNTIFIPTDDLSVEKNAVTVFEKIELLNDALYFMFSTVGGYFGGPKIEETEMPDLTKMFTMNLYTSFSLHKQFIRLAKNAAGGSACYTSALTARQAEAGKAAYGASKAALSYFVETAAEEGKAAGVSVNAIAPFIIDTPANRSWMQDVDFNTLIQPAEAGDLVHSLFQHYHFVSGNIIYLKNRLTNS